MKKIFDIIASYDIEIVPTTCEEKEIYKCKGRQSGVVFYLDFNWNKDKKIKLYNTIKEVVIYCIIVEENFEEILTIIEGFDSKIGEILIFDAKEDVQFFSKDFWNLYITL